MKISSTHSNIIQLAGGVHTIVRKRSQHFMCTQADSDRKQFSYKLAFRMSDENGIHIFL